MKIGIIGAGKAGCSMGKYMKEHGLTVAGYFSRRTESSEEAGTFTGTKAFKDLESMIKACDILCIAVSDDAIGSVWSEICEVSGREPAARSLENKIICHFSGSLSSDVFFGIEDTGAAACSVHPMYAFSDRFTSYRQLNQVLFTMEGQNKALQVMEGLFSRMGNKVLKIQPEKKALYHCSASLVSNFMVGLFELGLNLLERCGIDEDSGRELLGPLVENNVREMVQRGTADALTGPIERCDVQTVEKHLMALEGDERELYRLLGRRVLSVAKRKNPQRNYGRLEEMLG